MNGRYSANVLFSFFCFTHMKASKIKKNKEQKSIKKSLASQLLSELQDTEKTELKDNHLFKYMLFCEMKRRMSQKKERGGLIINSKEEGRKGALRISEDGAQYPNLKYRKPKYENVESILKYVETPEEKGQGVKLVIMNFND